LDLPKQERFRELRRKEDEGRLTPEDQDELSALIREIEDAEASYLDPANERLAHECETLEAQNRELEALVKRKEALRTRLESILAEAQSERQAIDQEISRMVGKRPHAGTVSGN
jgi:predicted  nucleic acid-binding Zn-ribbon protein